MTETQEHPPPILKTLMVVPREVMTEVRECLPSILKTSMVGPLGGNVGDTGAPTTNLGDDDGGPLGR
jgi:hypothetical protein